MHTSTFTLVALFLAGANAAVGEGSFSAIPEPTNGFPPSLSIPSDGPSAHPTGEHHSRTHHSIPSGGFPTGEHHSRTRHSIPSGGFPTGRHHSHSHHRSGHHSFPTGFPSRPSGEAGGCAAISGALSCSTLAAGPTGRPHHGDGRPHHGDGRPHHGDGRQHHDDSPKSNKASRPDCYSVIPGSFTTSGTQIVPVKPTVMPCWKVDGEGTESTKAWSLSGSWALPTSTGGGDAPAPTSDLTLPTIADPSSAFPSETSDLAPAPTGDETDEP